MTPNERACLIISGWSPSLWEPDTGAEVTDESMAELGVMIESQIEQAVAAERERHWETLRKIGLSALEAADAIRARGQS